MTICFLMILCILTKSGSDNASQLMARCKQRRSAPGAVDVLLGSGGSGEAYF